MLNNQKADKFPKKYFGNQGNKEMILLEPKNLQQKDEKQQKHQPIIDVINLVSPKSKPIWKQERLDEMPVQSKYIEKQQFANKNTLINNLKKNKKINSRRLSQYDQERAQIRKTFSPDYNKMNVNKFVKSTKSVEKVRPDVNNSEHKRDKEMLEFSRQSAKEKKQDFTNLLNRNQLWLEKKRERIVQKELEQDRNETKECTFQPRIVSPSPAKSFCGEEFYEKNLLWSKQIKYNIKAKQEKEFKEITVICLYIAI